MVNSLGPGFGGSFGTMDSDCVFQGRKKVAMSEIQDGQS